MQDPRGGEPTKGEIELRKERSKIAGKKSPAKHAVTSGAKDEYGESINPRKTLHTEVVDGHAHKKNTKPKNVKKK